jgi:hypothetical protein
MPLRTVNPTASRDVRASPTGATGRLHRTKSESAALTPRRFPQGAGSERLEAEDPLPL